MGKSSGLDGILPEHIVYGGEMLKVWLKKVYNTLEEFPKCFKEAIVMPIYKRILYWLTLIVGLHYHPCCQRFWKSSFCNVCPLFWTTEPSRSAANCFSERYFCYPRDSHVSPSRWWPALSMSLRHGKSI